jgi:Domain of unknown function (DUF4185)
MNARLTSLASAAFVVVALGGGVRAEGAHPQGPPPIPGIRSVTDLGSVSQNPVISARDGIMSGEFDGQSFWAFGDTVLTVPGRDGDSWSDNTLSWTTDLDASDGITLAGDHLDSTGAPTEFLPWTPEERRFNERHDPQLCTQQPCGAEYALWGGPVVPDPERDRLLLPYMEIYRVIGNPGWKTIGAGIATWTPGSPVVRPIENPGSRTPTLMWGPSEIPYTSGWVSDGETLFAYGCQAGFLVQHCHVARVGLADATDKAKWTYYAGGETWSSTPADSVTVFEGGAAGNAIQYLPYLGEYLAVYNGVFSDEVRYRVSSTPWGPWSDEAVMFVGLPGWQGSIDYAAEAHPEYAQDGGRTQFVTYFHTTGFLEGNIPLVEVVFGP